MRSSSSLSFRSVRFVLIEPLREGTNVLSRRSNATWFAIEKHGSYLTHAAIPSVLDQHAVRLPISQDPNAASGLTCHEQD